MTCEHTIPDTAGGEHLCGLPAVVTWKHKEGTSVVLCKRHDEKAIRANVIDWTRMAELAFAAVSR